MTPRDRILAASSKRLNSLKVVTEADLIAHYNLVFPNGKPDKMLDAEWAARHMPYSDEKGKLGATVIEAPEKHTCPTFEDAMSKWVIESAASSLMGCGPGDDLYDKSTGEDRARYDRLLAAERKKLEEWPNPSLAA